MPILLSGAINQKFLEKELKRLKISKSQIDKVYFANNSALVYFKDESMCEYFKDLIPSKRTVEEIRRVHHYVERFKKLIEYEREAEIEFQKEEMRKLPGKERELLGRAILNLTGSKAGTKFHYYLLRFYRKRPIETEISSGDMVVVSRGNPLRSDFIGTVVSVTERTITVAFEEKPPKWALQRGVRIDLYANDITYKRMEENLENLRHISGRPKELRDIIVGIKKPDESIEKVDFSPFDEKLNQAQKEAVKKALSAKDFFLIHGPPGTGKTRTLTEIILQLVKRGLRVLATADSNIAVDNLLLNLSKYPDLKLVRIGHPVRIMEELERFSIFALMEASSEGIEISQKWKKVRNLIEKRNTYTKPIPALRRGLSDEEILYLSKKNQGARGISKKIIHSMARWLTLNFEIERQIEELKLAEKELLNKIILSANVVLSTNSMVESEFLKDFSFDVAVIDEGSQQIEPSTLIPIAHAKKFIIAGDHKQLPPTILNEKAKELELTLFERLINQYPKLSEILTFQYRMNEKIMEFSNKEFYKGVLKADESVKNHTLADFSIVQPSKYKNLLNPQVVIAFLDTSSLNTDEFQPLGSTSYENYGEAQIVLEICEELLKMGIKREQIGVITPYSAQVKLLKQLFLEKGIKIEINTVDGFQGREKEVIIISFVRSNPEGEIGFLKDLRRLNVAITRAKRKLICVGNAQTLSSHPFYKKFLDYIKENGLLEKIKI